MFLQFIIPTPLRHWILNFHGYTSGASTQLAYGDFRSIADTAGFIIAHPQGTDDNSGNPHWNVGWGGSNVDDIGFAAALIDTISASFNIDQDRVYSTGFSNGGFMSHLLACQLGNRIAAIAAVAGSMSPPMFNACNPSGPTPVLQIHGNQDPVVPYIGLPTVAKSVSDVLQYWSTFDNCNPTPSATALPNTNTNDGSTVEHIVYSGCDNSITVEHFKVLGGGHAWPGSSVTLPGTNRDIDASLEIWKFFSRYDRNGLITGTDETEASRTTLQVMPNPNPGTFQIAFPEGVELLRQIQVMNTAGQVVYTSENLSKGEPISIGGICNGIYTLQAIYRNEVYRSNFVVNVF